MPFKSKAQRRKFAQLLVEGKISDETYEEWNRETGGQVLPERVAPKPSRKRAARKKTARKTARKAAPRKAAPRRKAARATTPRRKRRT
jgi:topoisomerase IA-like protein